MTLSSFDKLIAGEKAQAHKSVAEFKLLEVRAGEVAWIPYGMCGVALWVSADLDPKQEGEEDDQIAYAIVQNVFVEQWAKGLEQEVFDKLFQEMNPFCIKNIDTESFGPSGSYVKAFCAKASAT